MRCCMCAKHHAKWCDVISVLQAVLSDLEADLRRMMLPNTALNLKESKRNVLQVGC